MAPIQTLLDAIRAIRGRHLYVTYVALYIALVRSQRPRPEQVVPRQGLRPTQRASGVSDDVSDASAMTDGVNMRPTGSRMIRRGDSPNGAAEYPLRLTTERLCGPPRGPAGRPGGSGFTGCHSSVPCWTVSRRPLHAAPTCPNPGEADGCLEDRREFSVSRFSGRWTRTVLRL